MKIRTYFITIVFSIFFLQIIFVSVADAANKIMPLGDSITYDDRSGDTRTDGQKIAYRYRLWQLLIDAGYDFDFVGSQYTGFDFFSDAENEGHPGWTDDEIVNGRPPFVGNLAIWLADEQPKIVLLHIGTNGLDPSPDDVAAILDEIDAYETANSVVIWVILARIINRNCKIESPLCPADSATTTLFNNNVEDMALDRITDPTNPAFPDKIIIVDMEESADIDYRLQPAGDMWDNLHPYEVGDDSGYSKMANVWFTALEGILPQANAGNPRTVKENVTVLLNGSSSIDPDGTIISHLWEQLPGGTQVPLSGASTATASFTAPPVTAAGETLMFQLTVTDDDGLVSTDTVSIDVINTINPVADAGDDQTVTEGDMVTLDGTDSTDADGTIVSYLWVEVTTTGVTINNDTSTPTATFTAPPVTAAGEILTFKLTVTDDDGLKDSDNTTVSVINNPIAPTADAGPDQEVNEGNPVTLDGSNSSDPDGTIVSYRWEQVPVPTVTLTNAATATATFTAPDVGPAGETLTFRLTVTDDNGLTSSDDMNVNVAEPLLAVAGDDQNVTVGDTVTLDGTDSTGPIASYTWIQRSGTPVQLSGADTATATFTYNPGAAAAAAETLTFELTVVDNTGLIDSNDTVGVNVDDGIAPDTGGGGGGGGGCFIATATNGSPMALNGKNLHELLSKFAMVNWKRLMAGNISRLTPRAEHGVTLAIMVAMVVLISSCVAITLRKPRKRWLKS